MLIDLNENYTSVFFRKFVSVVLQNGKCFADRSFYGIFHRAIFQRICGGWSRWGEIVTSTAHNNRSEMYPCIGISVPNKAVDPLRFSGDCSAPEKSPCVGRRLSVITYVPSTSAGQRTPQTGNSATLTASAHNDRASSPAASGVRPSDNLTELRRIVTDY